MLFFFFCQIAASGIHSVAVQIGTDTFEIYGGRNRDDIKGSIYMNGDAMGFVGNLTFGDSYTYSRTKVSQHTFQFLNDVTLELTIGGRPILVKVTVPMNHTTKGLIGKYTFFVNCIF